MVRGVSNFCVVQQTSLGVCGWQPHTRHTEVVAEPEPAWHRNERSRRKRARLTIKAAAAGKQCGGRKLAAVEAVVLRHHATRGTAKEAMGHGKHGEGSADAKAPWPDDWKCPNCSVVGAPHFSVGGAGAIKIKRFSVPPIFQFSPPPIFFAFQIVHISVAWVGRPPS